MRYLELAGGKHAIVDVDDFDYLSQWRWRVKSSGYAVAEIDGKAVRMHRLVNKTPDGLVTDHINGNKLDNRKSNLRTVTQAKNLMNRRGNKISTSPFKGVSWDKGNNRWVAQIKYGGKCRHLGSFKDEISAALAYNSAAVKYFGEYAHINSF